MYFGRWSLRSTSNYKDKISLYSKKAYRRTNIIFLLYFFFSQNLTLCCKIFLHLDLSKYQFINYYILKLIIYKTLLKRLIIILFGLNIQVIRDYFKVLAQNYLFLISLSTNHLFSNFSFFLVSPHLPFLITYLHYFHTVP